MATQHGIIKLTGQIGGISFYKMEGKYYARMKTCHSKERIQNDPAFAKTYQCGLDFGEASRTSKQLRHAWASVLPNVADNRVAGRLTGKLVKVLQGDSCHAAGRRKVAHGDLSFLKGFEFNKYAAFSNVFSPTYQVSISRRTNEASIYIPAWNTRDGISASTGATHVRLVAVVTSVDFKNGGYKANICRSTYLDLSRDRQPSLELVNAIEGTSKGAVIVALGIESYQQVNGEMKILMKGSAMVIAEAVYSQQPNVHGRRSTVHGKEDNASKMFHGERQVGVEVNGRQKSQKRKIGSDEILKRFWPAYVDSVREVRGTSLTFTRHKRRYVSLNPRSMIQTPAAETTNKKKPSINYIAHLNAWYDCLKTDRRLTASHNSLYMVLFFEWNANWFRNPVYVYRNDVMPQSGIGSRNTYAKCLRELAEWGYIIYTPGENRSRGSVIEMVPLASRKAEVHADGFAFAE